MQSHDLRLRTSVLLALSLPLVSTLQLLKIRVTRWHLGRCEELRFYTNRRINETVDRTAWCRWLENLRIHGFEESHHLEKQRRFLSHASRWLWHSNRGCQSSYQVLELSQRNKDQTLKQSTWRPNEQQWRATANNLLSHRTLEHPEIDDFWH